MISRKCPPLEERYKGKRKVGQGCVSKSQGASVLQGRKGEEVRKADRLEL